VCIAVLQFVYVSGAKTEQIGTPAEGTVCTATHCNTLQHTATHYRAESERKRPPTRVQHTATHCNTLQHTATHYHTIPHTLYKNWSQGDYNTATYCNSVEQTATVLEQTAKKCNTMHNLTQKLSGMGLLGGVFIFFGRS